MKPMINDYESQRSQGAKAANGHLAQQLPPHGPYAMGMTGQEAHDLRTTVRANEDNQIVIPARAVPSAERVTNVYEAKLADNVQRRGTVQASEGITQRDGGVEQMFAGGFADARSASAPVFERKIANGRSGLADGTDSGNPAWSDAPRNLDAFAGTAYARELLTQRGNIPPLSARSSVSQVGTDLSRLDLTSKPRQMYGYTVGSDVRLPRYNEAEVRD